MNLELIKGICPIVAAPFAADESVDYDSLRNLVATLAKGVAMRSRSSASRANTTSWTMRSSAR